MGFLDSIGGLASLAQGDNAKVMGGLVTALEQHPGGIQGVLNSFQNNGLGDHAAAMANGEAPALTPEQVGQGLNGTGLIEQAAQHAGVSPQVVQMALTTILPLVVAHFAQNGGTPGAAGQGGGLDDLAGGLLKKFL